MNWTAVIRACAVPAIGMLMILTLPTQVLASQPTAPGVPQGSVSDGKVSLQWAPSTDDDEIGGYNVYLNEAYLKTVFSNSYSGDLDTSRDNSFYITAFDTPPQGEIRSYSTRSPSVILRKNSNGDEPVVERPPVDLTAPSVPEGLTLRNATTDSVRFTWADSSDNVGVVGYNIYRQAKYISTVFTNSYTDDNPLADTGNKYSVVAFDDARNYTSRSEELTVKLPGTDPEPDTKRPSKPLGISARITRNKAVVLTWTASTDAVGVDGYKIYRNGRLLDTVTEPTFRDLAPDRDRVTYHVVAFDLAGNNSRRSKKLVVQLTEQEPMPDPMPDPDPIPGEQVPVLDPSNRFPSPDPADPFGSQLEIDPELAQTGGAPTTPKNLRIDLVSNNWAEFSWAPANDDVGVEAYNIYRSDGVRYIVAANQTDENPGSQAEIDKYWSTTSFIDCNFTRFDTRVHNCRANQPVSGETYTYQVSAVDGDGQESPLSKALSITYHLEENAPVPIFDDFYKMVDDRFAQNNDLSNTRFFLDEFDLVFSDEFDGTSVDATKWQTELTWQDSFIINGEQQYFVRTQVDPEFGYDPFSFDGDKLTISAIPTPDNLRDKLPPVCDVVDPSGNERCQFLSGALSTYDRFSFLYGYVEGRMKVGATPGMLSSFYLYHRYKGSGVNLHAPEIDIVEYLGENPFGDEDAFQTYHFDDVNTGLTRSSPTMSFKNPDGELYSDEYHTFGVLWEPQLVVWYIDGKEVKRLTGPMVSRQPMNIVNYLVTGSAWAPTPDISDPDIFPLEFDVDYIRVFQRDAYKSTASFTPP